MISSAPISVAVIIPNYNDGQYLPDCLNSVDNQSEPFDEIIIVDDASTDPDIEILIPYVEMTSTAQLLTLKKNCGTVNAINTGLQHCTADYVLFLSANDALHPALVKRFKASIGDKKIGVWSALVKVFDKDINQSKASRSLIISLTPKYYDARKCLLLFERYLNWFNGTTMFFSRSELMRHGGLSQELGGLADWLMAVVICLRKGAIFLPEYLGYVRRHGSGYLSNTLTDEDIGRRAWQYLVSISEHVSFSGCTRKKILSQIQWNRFRASREEFKKNGLAGRIKFVTVSCLLALRTLLPYKRFAVWILMSRLLSIVFHNFTRDNEKDWNYPGS